MGPMPLLLLLPLLLPLWLLLCPLFSLLMLFNDPVLLPKFNAHRLRPARGFDDGVRGVGVDDGVVVVVVVVMLLTWWWLMGGTLKVE